MMIIRRGEIPDEDRGGYTIKRLVTAALHSDPANFGLYETVTPKGSVCREHYHANLDEVIYFVTRGKLGASGVTYQMEAGDAVVLLPGDPHSIIADENDVVNFSIKMPNEPLDKVVVS